MSLQGLTEEIKQLIDQRHRHYIEAEGPINKSDRDYFNQVKKETIPMFELNNVWRDEAEIFVKDRKASVHPNQIKSTHENIEMIILHSYYLDVDKKRFKELHQSSHYVLNMILNDLTS